MVFKPIDNESRDPSHTVAIGAFMVLLLVVLLSAFSSCVGHGTHRIVEDEGITAAGI